MAGGRILAGWLVAAAVGASIAACGGGDGGGAGTDPSPPWREQVKPAKAGSKVGPGTSCDLPVRFDVAQKWQAETVDVDYESGGLKLRCEIDGKPAGLLGVMRVWVRDSGGDAKVVLEAFVADWGEGGRNHVYRQTKVGATDGWEVHYRASASDERAFVITAGDQVVIVSWRAFDDEEFAEGLPAYLLAKASCTPA